MKNNQDFLKKIAEEEIEKEEFDIKKEKVKNLLRDINKARKVVSNLEDTLNAILSE